MSENQLAFILEKFYDSQPKGSKAISAQIFGYYFASDIKNPKTLMEKTSLSKNYATEIRKGIKLSEYIKSDYLKEETKKKLEDFKKLFNNK